MTSNELKNVISQINAQGKMHFIEGESEEQIAEFENKCGVVYYI